ncbi:MAG: stringent starvation protein B [Saprospiraceae bacterium]|jgi:stringent starvation protein B
MTATTPYLIRGIHEWCTDEGLTPYMLVDATVKGVTVPMNLVTDGTIVMNLDHSAVNHLELGNEWILFSARFGGKSRDINIPVAAVRAIYAKENGQGCMFPEVTETAEIEADSKAPAPAPARLKAASKGDASPEGKAAPRPTTGEKPVLKSMTKRKPPKKPTDKKKPSLKLVD